MMTLSIIVSKIPSPPIFRTTRAASGTLTSWRLLAGFSVSESVLRRSRPGSINITGTGSTFHGAANECMEGMPQPCRWFGPRVAPGQPTVGRGTSRASRTRVRSRPCVRGRFTKETNQLLLNAVLQALGASIWSCWYRIEWQGFEQCFRSQMALKTTHKSCPH